jgi:K(+)-stimulated pyrophosphate-energized sodium pump
MVVRTEDALSPAAALWRGQLTTSIVSLGGLVGASFWLLGEPTFLRFALAGAAGASACALVAHAARLRVERRFSVLKDVLESQRAGDATAIAHGLGVGLGASALPVLIVGAAMALSFQLGAGSGLANGGLYGVVVALSALLAGGPYLITLSSIGPIADSARGVLSMTPDAALGETELRAGRLDDAGFAASAVAQTYLIVIGALSALLAAAALPLVAGKGPGAAGVDLAKPVVLWSGALGAAAVLGYAGSGLQAGARAVRGLFLEVERQLRGFPRERGFPQVPADFTPSYRACVELSTRLALEKLALPVAAALLAPAALGVGLRLLYLSSDPGLPAEGLTAFVVVASITGLAATLAVEAARATLGAARRASRPRGATPGFAASVSGDAVADLVGSSAGPAAQLLIRAVAVSALAVAPFVT